MPVNWGSLRAVSWLFATLLAAAQPAAGQLNTFLVNVEIQTANTPSLRLHQKPLLLGVQKEYRWDISGNDLAMTLTDFNADTDPVIVEAGTGTGTLYLAKGTGTSPLGDVGIGTSTPRFIGGPQSVPSIGGRNLNLRAVTGVARSIVQGKTAAETFLVHTDGAIDRKILRTRLTDDVYFMSTVPDTAVGFIEPYVFAIRMSTGNVGIRTPSPAHPLQVGAPGENKGNGAHVTAGGVWTNASSREVKQDITAIPLDEARACLQQLEPVHYRYKNEVDEVYAGFIAEDVPELVATRDRKSLSPMDLVAVLTRVVQDQDRELNRQRNQATEQQQRLTAQQKRLEQLEQRLAQLERP